MVYIRMKDGSKNLALKEHIECKRGRGGYFENGRIWTGLREESLHRAQTIDNYSGIAE